jgi:hypothetical protein
MDMYYPSLITLAVLLMSGLIYALVKYIKSHSTITPSNIDDSLDITKVIVVFIGNALKNNNFGNTKILSLIPIIVDALEHIKIIANAKTEEEAINDGMDVVKEMTSTYGIKISEDELAIIESIIKACFAMCIAHQQ